MKAMAFQQLSREGYDLVFEPVFPRSWALQWSGYRPDLFGVRTAGRSREYVVVECETHPNTRRICEKEFFRLELQTTLDGTDRLRRILIVPRGSLGSMDMKMRIACEIWLADVDGPAQRGGLAVLVHKVASIPRAV